MTRSRARARWGKPELLQEVGETATCPLMLKATLEPRDSPVQHKKKYANQHWPTEHLNKQPSVIFKVTTIITPTVAIDNQTSWIAFPECPCGPGYRTDNPNMPPVQLLHGSRTSSADATNAGELTAAGLPRQVSTSFAEGEFTEGHELPGKWQVPQAMIGRDDSQEEARRLLAKFNRRAAQ